MSFYTTDRDGITELNPPEKSLRSILRSLEEDRADNAEVWLTHCESDWTLTVFSTGTVHLENQTLDEPSRELEKVGFQKALELWLALSQGSLAYVKKQPWRVLDE